VEFAPNNQASETTGMSPFLANYRQDPLWQFDLGQATGRNEQSAVTSETRQALELASRFKEITEHLQAELARAQLIHQEQADKKRKSAPAFRVGDQVWFNAKNLSTQQPSRKLDHRRLGPYETTKVVSPYAYEIDFPPTLKHHSPC